MILYKLEMLHEYLWIEMWWKNKQLMSKINKKKNKIIGIL